MTGPAERLAAWKAMRAPVQLAFAGGTAAEESQWRLSLQLIEEQAKQAAFDVVRLERFALLREQNPGTRAALLADRARLWVTAHPEAWEGLL